MTGSADEYEESESVEVVLNNLRRETAGTEEEAAELLKEVIGMEVDGDGEGKGKGEREEGGDGTQHWEPKSS